MTRCVPLQRISWNGSTHLWAYAAHYGLSEILSEDFEQICPRSESISRVCVNIARSEDRSEEVRRQNPEDRIQNSECILNSGF